MNMYLSLFIFASLFCIGSAEEWSFSEETGYYYQVHRSTAGLDNWEAKAYCRGLGAKLATVQSKDENDFIYSISRHGSFNEENWDEMTLIDSTWTGDSLVANGEYANWANDRNLHEYSAMDKACTVMMTATQDYWAYKPEIYNYVIMRRGEWAPVQCGMKFKSVVCKSETKPEEVTSTKSIETTTTAEVTVETTSEETTQVFSVHQEGTAGTVKNSTSIPYTEFEDIEKKGLLVVIVFLLGCIICMLMTRKSPRVEKYVSSDSLEAATPSTLKDTSVKKSEDKDVSLYETLVKEIEARNEMKKENVGKGTEDIENGLYNAKFYPKFVDDNTFKVLIHDFEKL